MNPHDCRKGNCYSVRKPSLDSARKNVSQLEEFHMDTYHHWLKHKWFTPNKK